MRLAICCATLLLLTTLRSFAADDSKGVPPEQATFTPGKESKILDKETGGLGWYVVYTPKDYSPERDCPTIICYHGSNNDPKTWPFKELTDGQGYIIIGMEYTDRQAPKPDVEIQNLIRIRKFVASKLRIDAKRLFMGGFSQGGWSTSSFSNLYIDQLAGLIIMGSGGSPGEKAAAMLKGKPVFIGIGELDPANKNARSCREAYTAKEAAVTFEEFKGLEHNCDVKDKPLKDWLLKWGPQNQMVAAMALAKAAEKNGKLGDAYKLFTDAARMSGGEEAAQRAKEIGDEADRKLAEAEENVKAKKYPPAVKALVAVSELYAGSPMAEKAKARVTEIQTDPAIKAEVEQARLDARAEAIEQQAQAAEKNKDFARALGLYESYVATCAKAAHYATVKAHYEELKGDKSVTASAKGQSAERECKGWLSTADNYIKSGLPDKAKPYLQKIVEKYADTSWAGEAKKRLEEMK